MEDSMREVETQLHEVMGRLKHGRYVPRVSIEGLTPAEGGALMAIDQITVHGQPPRAGRVGAYLHLSPSALSQLLKSLEDKGLIERKREEDDSRKVALLLTDAGAHKAERGRAIMREYLNALEEYLGEDDLRSLAAILNKVDAYFREQAKQGKVEIRDEADAGFPPHPHPPFPPADGVGGGFPCA